MILLPDDRERGAYQRRGGAESAGCRGHRATRPPTRSAELRPPRREPRLPADFADRARLIAGDRLDRTPWIPVERRAIAFLWDAVYHAFIAIVFFLAIIGGHTLFRLFFGE